VATINVMEPDAVERFCPSCGSYVHRYLDHCAYCGWARLPAYLPLIPDPAPAIDGPLPTTRAQLARWLALNHVPPDVARERMADTSGLDDEEQLADQVFRAAAINSIKDANGDYNSAPYIAAVARWAADKMGRLQVRVMAQKLGYRYLGGVPEFPGPTDATLTYAGGHLLLRTSLGQVIAQIRPEQILFAKSSVQKTGGGSWLGLSFGHVIYFPDHSFIGGAVSVTWAMGNRATRTFVLGNRDGWAETKGQPDFYFGLLQVIGGWANTGACARQAEIGFPPYARELGFDAPDEPERPTPPSPSGSQINVVDALASLDQLKAKRLVGDDEYRAKRSEILGRL